MSILFCSLGPLPASVAFTITALACSSAFAQGTPSSKATAAINTGVGCTKVTAPPSIPDTYSQICHDIFSGAAVPVTADNL
jgi:hypothetical protein